MEIRKLESYFNPFSDVFKKKFEKALIRLEELPVWKRIVIVVVSILLVIPGIGGGGVAVFRKLVKVWKDPEEGEGISGTSSVRKTKKVWEDYSGVDKTQKKKEADGGKNKSSSSSKATSTTTSKGKASLQSSPHHYFNKGTRKISRKTLNEMLKAFETESVRLEEDLSHKKLSVFFEKDLQEGVGSEDFVKKTNVLVQLAEWHYQLSEWHHTIRELLQRKEIIYEEKVNQVRQIDLLIGTLEGRLEKKLEKHQEEMLALYNSVKENVKVIGLSNFEPAFLYEYARILRLLERLHMRMIPKVKSPVEKFRELDLRVDRRLERPVESLEEKRLEEIQKEHAKVKALLRENDPFSKSAEKKRTDTKSTTQTTTQSTTDSTTDTQSITGAESVKTQNAAAKRVQDRPSQPHTPITSLQGIPNVTNSCYMNSSLQVILGTRLSTYLEKPALEPPVPTHHDLLIFEFMQRYEMEVDDYERKQAHREALTGVLAAYGKSATEKAEAARALRRVVFNEDTYLIPLSGLYRQQDAGEMMRLLLDAIDCKFYLQSTVSAENDRSCSHELANMLVLSMKSTGNNIKDMLKEFKTEVVDDEENAWEVDGRKKHKKYTKEQVFSQEIPEVVVMQVKRFNYDKKTLMTLKNDAPVAIPDEIDLAGMMSPNLLTEGETTRYRLAAYINHKGSSASGGHYTSNVIRDNKWHTCNDSTVSKASSEKRDREKAYILVWERVH